MIVAVAAMALAGHAQMLVYGGVVASAYVVVFTWHAPIGRVRFLLLAGAVAALGFGVAAVQLLPTAELVGLGRRAATLDYAILDLGSDDPMDLNGDGVVDELDLAAWHPLMLEDDARGDLDGDGVVDEGDLQLLRARILAAAAAAKEDGTIH